MRQRFKIRTTNLSNRFVQITVVLFLLFPTKKLQAITDSILYDQSKISPVNNLPEKPSNIYTGKDFIYEIPQKDSDSDSNFLSKYFDWIVQKIFNFIKKLFNFNTEQNQVSDRNLLNFILILLLGILLIVGLLFLIKKFRKTIGRNDEDILSAEEVEKNIDTVDFDQLIYQAVSDKNYRLAIRFYYLRILKLMANKKVIEYHRNKTNYDYFYEIKNYDLKNLFQSTSKTFDYSWYGDYSPKESDFLLAKSKFLELQQMISKL
ncbi:hypothetical protein ETU10_06045 [Apibacter muscae]|uniref:hypothetical protein n=1 Tax=Apibacter muscae TaxID=2509004 RepID=UPI0011AD8E37|nr:hypothetical protein [Apibacter muscae]TWP23792.1 hypothetical protein ETU10_06045 [Apibacter muscae]